MNVRALAAGAALAAGIAFLTRGAGLVAPVPVSGPVLPSPRPAPTPAGGSPAGDAPARNLFEYTRPGTERESRSPRRMAAAPVPAPVASAPNAPLARLIGFVKKGGILKAAISVAGEVAVVRAGDRIGGYEVLALDEEDGVRLRSPAGEEIQLAPPSS